MTPAILLATASALALGVSLLCSACVLIHVRRDPAPPSTELSTPPISVLKPLKGAEPELYDNLAALARQDYPELEIVCGVEDPDDPALDVVRRIREDFPTVPIHVVAGTASSGLNPKVRNLASLSRRARHDLWLISDADVRPRPDYLRSMARELNEPHVGLVSSPLGGVGALRTGARLDNLHLGTFVAGGVCAARVLASHPCVVGKSMLFRRRDLEAVGGWAAVADVLAEDYVLGRRFHQAGMKVGLARQPLAVVHPRRSFMGFLSRHLRWCQMRWRIAPLAYLGEPLLNPTPWLLALLALGLGSRPELAWAAVCGLWLKTVADAATIRRLTGARPTWKDLAWMPVKDCAILAVWVLGAFKTTLSWRGNRMRIGSGSRLFPVESPPTETLSPEPTPEVSP